MRLKIDVPVFRDSCSENCCLLRVNSDHLFQQLWFLFLVRKERLIKTTDKSNPKHNAINKNFSPCMRLHTHHQGSWLSRGDTEIEWGGMGREHREQRRAGEPCAGKAPAAACAERCGHSPSNRCGNRWTSLRRGKPSPENPREGEAEPWGLTWTKQFCIIYAKCN